MRRRRRRRRRCYNPDVWGDSGEANITAVLALRINMFSLRVSLMFF